MSLFSSLMEYSVVQAIEAAIELNLSKVEAGAQGEHKIQRGYLPVTTYSCHYFSDPGFGKAIGNFLANETAQVFFGSILSTSFSTKSLFQSMCA